MGLLDGAGHEVAARTLLLGDAEQSFIFDDIAEQPMPSLLRGFSAPVKLSGVPLAQLRFLAAHDTDPFVRWESGSNTRRICCWRWPPRGGAARRRHSIRA